MNESYEFLTFYESFRAKKKTNKNHIFTFYITQNTGDNDK